MKDGPVDRGDNQELEQAGRELRQQVGGEFRLGAEEDEYWAMKQARRAGSLSEIAYDAMSRGDRIEIRAGDRVFRGHIRHTRGDLLALRAQVDIDINLAAPMVLRIIEPAAVPGLGPTPHGPASFGARMAELEQTEQIFEFITPYTDSPVVGKVSIRARDHVVVEDSDRQEWVIPLKWLTAVVSRQPIPPGDRVS
jgi:hypothetical protein